MKYEMNYGQKLSLMRNELMRATDEHERYYSIIIDSISQIVGAKGLCDAWKPRSGKRPVLASPKVQPAHSTKTRQLCRQPVQTRVCYSSSCRFAADEDPAGLCRRGNWCSSWPPWPDKRCGGIRCSYTPCVRRRLLTKSSPYPGSRQSAQDCPSQTLHRKVPRTRVAAILRQLEVSGPGCNGSRWRIPKRSFAILMWSDSMQALGSIHRSNKSFTSGCQHRSYSRLRRQN